MESAQELARIQGASPSAVAYVLARWFSGERLSSYANIDRPSPKRALILLPDSKRAEDFALDLEFFSGVPVHLFPSWELLPFEALSPTTENIARRMEVLAKALSGESFFVVSCLDALSLSCVTPALLSHAQLSLRVQSTVDRDSLLEALDALGYRRSTLTEELGQLSVRGAVIDLFPPGTKNPIRLEFFGDLLESIREFRADSQLSIRELGAFTILPCQESLAPWRIAEVPLFQGFTAHEDESLEAASNRIRARAEALNTPTRELDYYLDLIRTNSDFPGGEQFLPYLQPRRSSFFEYLGENAEVILVDPVAIEEGEEQLRELIEERYSIAEREGRIVSRALTVSNLGEEVSKRATLSIENPSTVHFEEPSEIFGVPTQEHALQVSPLSELIVSLRRERQSELPLKPLAQEIELRRSQGFEVAFAVSHSKKVPRFHELLETYGIATYEEVSGFAQWYSRAAERRKEYRITTKAPVALIHGALNAGIRVSRDGLLLLSDHEIFPDLSLRKPSRSAHQARRVLGSASQLKEDDFVVHIDHGVALYRGLKTIELDGKASDFLHLEYAEGAKLFVPVENLSKVQKYVGADGKKPALTRLGGKSWSQTKEKVRKNVQELAGQLLNLYAQRELVEGVSFGPPDAADRGFADTFAFEETPDQEKAIHDVLADMSRTRPMDRLVCGDVGYGKTEVALRAAFKAVHAGKQVAVLVPTTILADQHYQTFHQRLAPFGYTVASVSRFSSPAENRATVEKLATGAVDVVVGTHRLLQKDVHFRDLGLVIIDEEHRFGVADKEKLKRIRTSVDVLTLTATPIPRTLHMSLLNIRDLSVIETPPTNRQVVQTYLATYQDSTVRQAILRELSRSGQVFYIHNRVQNIQLVCDELRAVVPEARIEFAHGQMRDEELETVMHRFIEHQFDVLVATTIVESGLDIPNANTMIIRNADRFGLAELYQLRGRVGRSSRRAYAYLLVQDPKNLGPDAKKRLEVLKSLDDLGVGFRLALQDMEIRGAGNLLGKDQSGKIELVGFDLYSRILKEAVRELRARGNLELLELSVDPEVSVGFPSHIPRSFIPDVEERILLYQRLNDIRTPVEFADMTDEIRDRFGTPPPEVRMLLETMRLKSILRRGCITNASRRGLTFSLTFHRDAPLKLEILKDLVARSRGRLRLSEPLTVHILLDDEPESPNILSEKAHALLELVLGPS